MIALYMVATPIGNLGDITMRALETLRNVDYVACEDTRHTRKLLSAYQIEKPLLACHRHNERASAQGIIKLMREGKSVAYCSDAGSPCISDPGARLVESVVAAGFRVSPIPGASAFAALVSVSAPVEDPEILFVGFLAPKGMKREEAIKKYLNSGFAFVLYESPYRMAKLAEELGRLAPARKIVVGREITKIYEEFWRGPACDLMEKSQFELARGEYSVLISTEEFSDANVSGIFFDNSSEGNPRDLRSGR